MGGGGSKESPSPFPISNFQDHLLTPPDDKSVRQTWTILRSAIDSHARRFYHSDPVYHSRELVREAIHEAGIVYDAQEAEDLATLLHSPRHRRLGLRICLARVMVASIDLYGNPEETSLEPSVVELLRKFEALRPELGTEQEAALAAWRMITAFFLQPAAQDLRTESKPCVATLERLLHAFIRSNSDAERDLRLAGLSAVAERAVELGEKIFCHAARWRFEWRPPADDAESLDKYMRGRDGRRRSIVVFPALLRSDDEGVKKRGGLSYVIVKRKAVSAGSFFDVAPAESSSSSSDGEESETPEEAPPSRGRSRPKSAKSIKSSVRKK